MFAVPHVLTRKLVVLPLVSALVAVAVFEVYGYYTRHQPVHYARGGDAFAATPALTPSPHAASAAATPRPAGAASPTAAVSATSSPGGAAVSGTAQIAATAPVAAPRAGRSDRLALPRAGVYQLAVDGSEDVHFGPVGFCSQPLPTRTSLVVSRAAGESGMSYNFDVRFFPDSVGKHDERHIYRYTSGGTYLDYESATVTCQGVRQSSDTSFSPPQLRARLPLRVGTSWRSTTGDEDRTETSVNKVLRTQVLAVGAEHVLTYVVETTTSFTGSESGSRTQTWWYSPAWAMPLRWTEQINGQRSGASYREDVTVSVLSRP